jgi:hypothetical protein
MNIEEIKQLANNKLAFLLDRQNQAYMIGDTTTYFNVQPEIDEVRKLLDKLNS